jgi:nucleotide-binding universal stress UspA family protein
MALKDILVHVDHHDSSLVRLRLAADLAVRHGARLTALHVREKSPAQLDLRKAAELGLVSAQGLDELDRRIETSISAVAERLRSSLATLTRDCGVAAQLRSIDGETSTAVPQYARYADLCIVGHDRSDAPASTSYTFSEQLLFVTGRPVLFVPTAGRFETLGRHIAVAWNSSRPAARSLNDALPLLERAERTTVLMVNPSSFIGAHHAPPGEQLIEHLQRHGAFAEPAQFDHVPSDTIADKLQREARLLGADLLVAGAFGHPRLWEKLLGGVTHDLLARMSLPVFMSY